MDREKPGRLQSIGLQSMTEVTSIGRSMPHFISRINTSHGFGEVPFIFSTGPNILKNKWGNSRKVMQFVTQEENYNDKQST